MERRGAEDLAWTQWVQDRLAHLLGSPSESGKINYLQNRAASQQARAQAWPLGQETKNARPAPKRPFAAAESQACCQPRLCLLLRSQSLADPSQSPKMEGLPCCWPLWSVEFRHGLGPPETTEIIQRWESWVAFPGLGHPLVQFSFLNQRLRVLLRLQEVEDSHNLTAGPQPSAAPPPAFSLQVGTPGGGTGWKSTGLCYCKFYITSEQQARIPFRGSPPRIRWLWPPHAAGSLGPRLSAHRLLP